MLPCWERLLSIDTVRIVKGAAETALSDPELLKLLHAAKEYAMGYQLAKKRHKGCDGMGEVAMAREEFRDSLWTMTEYCKKKGYLSADIHYEIDSAAAELVD